METAITLDNAVQANFSPLMWTMDVLGNISEVFEVPFYNRQTRIISMTVIFTLAFIGNVAVLHKIYCSKSKRRKIDFLVTNLAAADLCVSIMTLLPQIIWEILEDEWLAGDLACRFFKVFQAFGLIASSNIIAIIASERFHVIVNPKQSPFPTEILTTVSWICALLLAAPQAFAFKLTIQGESGKCLNTFGQMPKWHFQMYITFGAIAVFFAPFCALCVAFTRILWTVWWRASVIEPSRNEDRKQHDPSIRTIAPSSSIRRAKIKTLKMTLVIIIFFIVCGLPYFIFEMKVAFGTISEADTEMIAVLGILVVSNSAINPYVYLFFKTNNVHLRRLEKRVCFSCLKGCRENTFQRELCAIGKRVGHTSIAVSEDDTVHHLTSVVNPSSPSCGPASCHTSL
ncbi:probable G-protein coupled receptor 150 [Pristis pectinata]|uniref:probable G-protein coupled receptor 150 n=1 Tax=Pristis pectinata TaxID=685728 RepID=UPI00223DA698|nr:probable G-protein coupled receptor 150 [Pristis pectinata]